MQPSRPGPRIYNLFPRLVGPIDDWHRHLPRLAAMGFDWVYVNPFHETGFSGSLYAVKDPYRFNPLFFGEEQTGESERRLERFAADANDHGIRVMIDLVINHTARDAPLAQRHPDWYRRDWNGDLRSPRAIDPADATRVTVWGDLAELDYGRPEPRGALVDYWRAYLLHMMELGVAGFRCDAAYMVPGETWASLIDAAKGRTPDALFVAETLGCTLPQIEQLRGSGFDFLFNSSKWWDFDADWLLEQYESFRDFAPSISFPESHDTDRLAAEAGTDDSEQAARLSKFRYLFAASFATGVMIPVGFEYGFRRRLDVVHTRPEDWEEPQFDISDFIAATNAMKAAEPVLNEEGPVRRLTAPHGALLGLMRESAARDNGGMVLLANRDGHHALQVDPGPAIVATGGIYADCADVTPQASTLGLVPGEEITLDPLALRLFHLEPAAPPVARTRDRAALVRLAEAARERIQIEHVWPEIDDGRHPVKRIAGEVLDVWADIFCDGHDQLGACIRFTAPGTTGEQTVAMTHFDNDRWVGHVPLRLRGRHTYTIEAWRDLFASWRADTVKKSAAGRDIALELAEGRALIEAAAGEGDADDRDHQRLAALMRRTGPDAAEADLAAVLLSHELAEIMGRIGPRADLARYRKDLTVVADRALARFGAWYELFPRSTGRPGEHGTFASVIAHLPYVRDMGFDVLYLPPIHPIGVTNRKGRNNAIKAQPGDPGSPYAIGSVDGGHTAVHPDLGTLDDFRRLVRAARTQGLEIALDFAIQCSPDHPWLKEHPEWFEWRADGSIRYAENPPKKYEDIVNVRFYGEAFPAVWYALRDVVLFWVEQGVRIFRVDNPHTKPAPFWEWLIAEVQRRQPETIFLSEAFTRPKMMKALAKLGFSQSYTYFTWRNTKAELIAYLTELTRDECKEYLRPNFFVNTPDINPIPLQGAPPAAFQIRAALAATLSSLWGMYSGFELCESTPLPGREEYLDSEKYEIKPRDWNRPGNIRPFIARLNRIRRDNPALHDFINLEFLPAHDDSLLVYAKATANRDNVLVIAVNLDPYASHEAMVELPIEILAAEGKARVEVEELFSGRRLVWQDRHQRVALDPQAIPCAIWRVVAPADGVAA